MARIGFIGLGNMGGPMAANLVKAGHEVRGFDLVDALRDQAARAAFDLVAVTAPDRLARNFVHQMVVLEELERHGVRVGSATGRSATTRTSSW